MNPRIVEVVGPAGAGKTTLCEALSCRNESIQLGTFPDVRKISDAPFFIRNGLQISPTLLKLPQAKGRKLTRREFAWLTILNGWPDVLERELKRSSKIIFLDQGPIYLMTELSEFGPGCLSSENARDMWLALFIRWATVLDAIIWLDGPNAHLSERIRIRQKEHLVKDKSRQTVFEFLDRYRAAYERTLSRLAMHRTDLRILRFDTNRRSPNEIAKRLLTEFGLQASIP
jgi:shikimate kinase